jgi:hypothetical protein
VRRFTRAGAAAEQKEGDKAEDRAAESSADGAVVITATPLTVHIGLDRGFLQYHCRSFHPLIYTSKIINISLFH